MNKPCLSYGDWREWPHYSMLVSRLTGMVARGNSFSNSKKRFSQTGHVCFQLYVNVFCFDWGHLSHYIPGPSPSQENSATTIVLNVHQVNHHGYPIGWDGNVYANLLAPNRPLGMHSPQGAEIILWMQIYQIPVMQIPLILTRLNKMTKLPGKSMQPCGG